MKPRSVMLSGAVAGCLIGFLAVRGAGPRLREMLADEAAAGRDRQPGGIHGDRASIRSERPGGNRASVKGRSFAELLKEVPAIAARNNPCKDVERMDVGQLKSLIRDCLPQPGSVPLADREVATMVRSAAARELYRRGALNPSNGRPRRSPPNIVRRSCRNC